jgi:uncharacterized repeat protein (TIGR03803 family)
MPRASFSKNSVPLRWPVKAILGLLLATIQPAHAQSFTTIYAFTGGADGSSPFGSLIKDKAGNVYGTASLGGIQSSECTLNGTGCGTVFELVHTGSSWSFNLLHSFGGYPVDGASPENESLTFDKAGNLYGTTIEGGTGGCDLDGCGTVFKLTPSENGWTESELYLFPGGNNVSQPDSGLVVDKKGNLYGASFDGGNYFYGAVYQVTAGGTERLVYSFTGKADGGGPFGGLLLDRKGNLYGTTYAGGTAGATCGSSGCGTVFKIAPDGTETVLYSFAGGTDGQSPYAGVIMDKLGNLYGTTWAGGGTACGGLGCGIVFKLAPDGTETILHSFESSEGAGLWGGVILDAKGNLYGTASSGGVSPSCCGTVYELTPSGGTWTATVLHSFGDGTDGNSPHGSLLLKGGILYGTAQLGGAYNQGTVFAINPRKKK